MAKINRPDADVQAFASEALPDERTVFDSSTQSDSLDSNLNASYKRGFGVYGPTDFPTLEDFNGMGFTISQLNAYLYQAGVPEWSVAQEYFKGSFTNVNGFIYVSNIENNIGNNPLLSTGGEVGVWENTGETQSLTINSFDRLIPLNLVNFVVADNSGAQLYSYINGGGYTSIGPGYTFPSVDGAYDFCTVDDDKFALIDNSGLTMFSVDIETGDIAQLGNKQAVVTTNSSAVSCAQLLQSSGDFVYVYFGETGEIKEYEFDGTDFTDNGVKYDNLSSTGVLSTLDKRDLLDKLAFLNTSTDEIIALDYNATTTLLEMSGDEFTTTGIDGVDDNIHYLTDNVILGVDSSSGELQAITFVNNVFTIIGSKIDLSGFGTSIASVAPLGSENVVIADDANDLLRAYQNNVGTGSTAWSLLPASSIGFNNSGTMFKSTNISDAIKEVLQVAYHVGSLWISDDPTPPSEKLGFGVWARIQGRFIVGVDDNDNDFDAAGKTGGRTVHSHSFNGETGVTSVSFTVSIDGWGSFQQGGALPEPSSFGRLVTGSGLSENAEALESLGHAQADQTFNTPGHTHSLNGETSAEFVVPPYYATYIWKRIA